MGCRSWTGSLVVLVGLVANGGCSSQEIPGHDAGVAGTGGTSSMTAGAGMTAAGHGGAGTTAAGSGSASMGAAQEDGGLPGSGGLDRSCVDGSDWCAWSCRQGRESGTGDSPYPFCDAAGQMVCPAGAVKLSTCPPHSCATFQDYCCDPSTGKDPPPACGADGLRASVCPDGKASSPFPDCVPSAATVTSSCIELAGTPCPTLNLECHRQGSCWCSRKVPDDGTLIWDCPPPR